MTSKAQTPAPARPSLGRLLLALRDTCPTLARPLGREFLLLWKNEIHRPYSASRWDLLRLLVLNREVAATAGGAEGDPYARTALLNMVRLVVRMGERSHLSARAVARMVDHDRDEDQWLRWLLARVEGGDGSEALKDWNPRNGPGRALREGCALLAKGGALSRPLLDYASAPDPPGEENTPLAAMRRLVRLHVARARLAEGNPKQAHKMAARAGPNLEPEARRIELEASLATGLTAPDHRRDRAREAQYAAYLAFRQARRHENQGFHLAGLRWHAEVEAWKALRERLRGEQEP